MLLRKTWQRTALWLGIGWSLLWSLLLSELPLIHQLDLNYLDRAIRLTHPHAPPPEIILVKIAQTDLKTWGLANEPMIYSNLANRILDAGAAVVVLNLLPNWVQTADRSNHPIATLVQSHKERLVIILPTTSATQPNPTAWRSYEYFLPANGEPRSILGFAEYEPEAKQPQSYRSTARQANLSGQFNLSRNLDSSQTLDSAALLALKKFRPQQPRKNPQTPIQIHFWGATGTFPTLTVPSVLKSTSLPQIRNKIVLVGFADPNHPDAFAIRSPFGELMPGVELQANLLASLLTGSEDRIVPIWLQTVFIGLGGILISQWVVFGKFNRRASRRYWYWLYPIFGCAGFGLVGIVLCGQGWILPITLPLFTWMATMMSVFISLQLGTQQETIDQQQCEIDRLHNVEQSAVISQAHKLLHRIASNIHDGPLQELKVVMDRLELLQMNSTPADLDPILDRLADLGHHLRQQLNQTREIALEITPELREGLDIGIAHKLHHLVESGELTLRVIQHLQPLPEPNLNSLWLEAREDIYRFFGEAIANVIHHAQPPQGTATQVQVSLEQQEGKCVLSIENDGSIVDPTAFEITPYQRQRGGYGTKLMETIAVELPAGAFEKIALPEGGVRVRLTWNLLFNNT